MSTWQERKDYVAQCLLARGLNKTSIIGMLCNVYYESARTFSPTIGEFSGGGGFGLFQFTNRHNQAEIIRYARTHSEKDAIKWQCNYVVDNSPYNYWGGYQGMTWQGFLHNTGNHNWEYMVRAFCWGYERPSPYYANVPGRIAAYNLIMPINWGSGVSGGDNTGGDKKPEKEEAKYPTMAECMSLFDKQNPSYNKPQDPDNTKPGPGPAVGGFDNQPCISYVNAHIGKLWYSQPYRAGVSRGTSADCSSFVSWMLHLGYHDNDTFLYTTESLHERLGRLGYHCIEQGATLKAHHPFKTGDVIIEGLKGHSLGNFGHTGICLDAPRFCDCSYSGRGLKWYASGQAFLDWNYSTNYWYHYTK